jgi:peroxiredoxin
MARIGKRERKGRRKFLSTSNKSGDGTKRNEEKGGAAKTSPRGRALRIGGAAVLFVGIAVLALGAIFYANSQNRSSSGAPGSGDAKAGEYAYKVGSPGPGEKAPPIRLPSTKGGTFDLGSARGESVLLYFQEGLMCEPCWDQLKDIEARRGEFQDLGIDRVVSITTDPLGALEQKVESKGISTPVLSDPNLAVSKAYNTNKYGMMGKSRNGHSFIVVGPDGEIKWRADYGGAPGYTMYVPVENLLADMRKGLEKAPR